MIHAAIIHTSRYVCQADFYLLIRLIHFSDRMISVDSISVRAATPKYGIFRSELPIGVLQQDMVTQLSICDAV